MINMVYNGGSYKKIYRIIIGKKIHQVHVCPGHYCVVRPVR